MTVPFPDLDPYEVLGVKTKANDNTIKKAYRKLCLKYHPDKLPKGLTEDESKDFKEKFEQVQFAYKILNDSNARARYDKTGALEPSDSGNDFNWSEFFKEMAMSPEITAEAIEKDKIEYRNPETGQEADDIFNAFEASGGDVPYLFECIPHLEYSVEEEERVMEIIDDLDSNGAFNKNDPSRFPKYKKYLAQRTKWIKKMTKKAAKEAKEAAAAQKKLEEMAKKHNVELDDSEDSLKALIQARHNDDSAFKSLIAKYEGGFKASQKE
ncbi:unnamed protein product [Ambrosiozyma monospora]|uniref:Unnamed protein product n=1 Tax=Ambrosiozyma monospora TaxID=43982 RepID=A0ACB5TAK1_AMBMO|nr:unnamed protein product [Ambrosiozyma monospora]